MVESEQMEKIGRLDTDMWIFTRISDLVNNMSR